MHVDLATKLIIGYPLKDKTYGEVLRAIESISDQHKLAEHPLQKHRFDRESSIVVMQEDIEARGIKLFLKAAGQKVGLAEASIKLISEKARATKAKQELSMATYLQPVNVDLCLDTISVLNRTRKEGYQATPYELFTGDSIDHTRDFRCRWGELIGDNPDWSHVGESPSMAAHIASVLGCPILSCNCITRTLYVLESRLITALACTISSMWLSSSWGSALIARDKSSRSTAHLLPCLWT